MLKIQLSDASQKNHRWPVRWRLFPAQQWSLLKERIDHCLWVASQENPDSCEAGICDISRIRDMLPYGNCNRY